MATHKGSWTEWLLSFEKGERRYVETEHAEYKRVMRSILAPTISSRRRIPVSWKFTMNLFTAIGSHIGDIRYLVCVERLK